MQGTAKFGFYEIFKNVYGNAMGEEAAYQYMTVLYLAASASAEFFADIALCPMEAVKVKIQTIFCIMMFFLTSLLPMFYTYFVVSKYYYVSY